MKKRQKMVSASPRNSDAYAMTINVQLETKVPQTKRDGPATLVQCDGFRCLAYLDRKGIWRGFFSDQELKGKIEIPDHATKRPIQSGLQWDI
jgi:hypothetical protein